MQSMVHGVAAPLPPFKVKVIPHASIVCIIVLYPSPVKVVLQVRDPRRRRRRAALLFSSLLLKLEAAGARAHNTTPPLFCSLGDSNTPKSPGVPRVPSEPASRARKYSCPGAYSYHFFLVVWQNLPCARK